MPLPLRRRPLDWLLMAFFAINAVFVTYIVDIEQLVIRDPSTFDYPLWPPRFFVDLVHRYGNAYDPLLMARPAFFQMTIWIDVVYFGPFYLCALYALWRGRDWIRVPALVWAGLMMANVLIILFEERYGIHATAHFPVVLALNAPWLLLPILVIWRLRRDHPFAEAS
jgi:hypothetical protein